MTRMLGITSFYLLFLLTACGDFLSPATPGNKAAYQKGSTNCSQKFIDATNDVTNARNEFAKHSMLFGPTADSYQKEIDLFREKTRAYSEKYAKVECFAKVGKFPDFIKADKQVETWESEAASFQETVDRLQRKIDKK